MASLWITDRESLRRVGKTFVLWGVILLLLGVAVLVWPDLTGSLLVTLVGVLMLIAGALLLFGAWQARVIWGGLWWITAIPAIVLLVFGIVALASPELVSAIVLLVMAVVAIIAGANDVAGAFAVAKAFGWWWVRLLRGLLLIGLGIWLIASDVSGVAVLGAIAGVWAVVVGILSLAWGALVLKA